MRTFKAVTPRRWTEEEWLSSLMANPDVDVDHHPAYHRKAKLYPYVPPVGRIDADDPSTHPEFISPRIAKKHGLVKYNCAWVNQQGVVYALPWGTHDLVADYLGENILEVEASHARITLEAQSITEMMAFLTSPPSEEMKRAVRAFLYRKPEYSHVGLY